MAMSYRHLYMDYCEEQAAGQEQHPMPEHQEPKESWISRLWRRIKKASAWIDETFFPVKEEPFTWTEKNIQLLYQTRAKVETDCAFISKQIKSCKTLKQAYSIRSMIANLPKRYGHSTQVNDHMYLLNRELEAKEMHIIKY